jgi:hypothetical protein
MFKTLYHCDRTAARHETGPAAQSRLAYLEHLACRRCHSAGPPGKCGRALSCCYLHESGRYESAGARSSSESRDGMGAPEVSQRDGIQFGAERKGISSHHLPLAALRRAVAGAGSSFNSASGRTRRVLSVDDSRARIGASDRNHRAEPTT